MNGLFFYGFHSISVTNYSYKDMKNKFNYSPPINIQYDQNGNELHPRCNIVASNHLGFADILYLLYYYNGSFVSKKAIKVVFGIGAICKCMQGIFVESYVLCFSFEYMYELQEHVNKLQR